MVRIHAVAPGETLSALALRFHGEAERYPLIAAASGVADSNLIKVGQRLLFPDYTRYTAVPATRCRTWRRASKVRPICRG